MMISDRVTIAFLNILTDAVRETEKKKSFSRKKKSFGFVDVIHSLFSESAIYWCITGFVSLLPFLCLLLIFVLSPTVGSDCLYLLS